MGYDLRPLKNNPYKATTLVYTDYPLRRQKLDIHGVYFDVTPAGLLAEFRLDVMLLQLTTSLTLIAVSTTIVQMLAVYVLTHRKYYTTLLYKRSADMGEVL